MKPRSFLCCALPALSVLSAHAQITVNNSFLNTLPGHTLTQTTYAMNAQDFPSLSTIIGASGGNQTYDFTPYTYGAGGQLIYPVLGSAAGTPGESDPDFGGSNYVYYLDYGGGSGFWSYYNLSDDGYDYIGSYFGSAGGTQVNKNAPSDRVYAFPLTAGTTWDQSIVINSVSFGSESSYAITEHNEVDGWGMLITPMGSAPCLRLRKTRTDNVSGKAAATVDTYFFLTNSSISAAISSNSEGGGIVVASYSVLGLVGTGVEDLPSPDFSLEQNYPNPFSGSTTIEFELDRPQHATLRVFDLMGREVANLVDGQLAAGVHRAEFSGSGLSDGLYVYRLNVGGVVSVKSLVLRR